MKTLRFCPIALSVACVLSAVHAHASVLRVPSQYPNIQYALMQASANDTVLVAPGTCYENIVWPATPGIDLLSEAGRGATTIDGMSVNSVIRMVQPHDSTTVIRGFTIAHGSGDYGGGIHSTGGSPLIVDCRFVDNRARWYGGGFFCQSFACTPILRGNLFQRNTVENGSGGAICAYFDAFPTIVGNEFRENHADVYYGGAIHCEEESCSDEPIVIADNLFVGNTAFGGGAISVFNPYITPPEIRDNVIRENTAAIGGGLYTNWSLANVSQTIFAGNRAHMHGGAICTEESHNLNVHDCELVENQADCGGALALEWWTTAPEITNNSIRGNSATSGAGLSLYYYSSPTLRGNSIVGNVASGGGGAIACLQYCTPTIAANAITRNIGTSAVYMSEAAPTILDNVIAENSQCALYFSSVWAGHVPEIHENGIFGHEDYGLENMTDLDIPADNNWWGHATGPYHPTENPGGQGNRVSDFVIFRPWLTDPSGVSSVEGNAGAPLTLICLPNPFRGSANITCGQPGNPARGESAKLEIFDVTGRLLRSLPLDWGADGAAQISIGTDLPGGISWARVSAGGETRSLKLIRLPESRHD